MQFEKHKKKIFFCYQTRNCYIKYEIKYCVSYTRKSLKTYLNTLKIKNAIKFVKNKTFKRYFW